MPLGDGIRRNIKDVEPTERSMLRDAILELNRRFFFGSRSDPVPGGVSWWFKQDEIHQATHVHNGPEFLPWHRVIVNRFEELLRQINPQLSLHYWDWTEDPRSLSNANLGGGLTGTLNLFTPDFMGYGGATSAPIGPPWQNASAPWRSDGFYVPGVSPSRDGSGGTPADPPDEVRRSVVGSPATPAEDTAILNAGDYAGMRNLLEPVHDNMHGFVRMGGQHISFRDPFVFLLHSNVDRLFARWQTDPAHTTRLESEFVYGSESNLDVTVGTHIQNVNHNVEPWSTGESEDQFGTHHLTRPWYAPENEGDPHSYKHPSVVAPPCYDTNHAGAKPLVQVMNIGTPPVINFNSIPSGDTAMRAAVFRIYACGNVTVRVKAGAGPAAPFSVLSPLSGSITIGHGPHAYVDVRIWLAYTAGPAGVPVPDGAVTFECPEAGKDFTFVMKATAIARPTVAVMMALDQSGSMKDPAGTSGAIRMDVLKDAAGMFVELIQQNNGVGLIRFDHDSYPVNDPTYPGLAVSKMTSNDIDAARVAAIGAVNSHHTNLAGNTSVGDGVDRARQILNALPVADYQHHALLVFTDGRENEPLWISDVSGSIDQRTFAIGLGNEHQVNTRALRDLADGTNGFLYLTGLLTSSLDDYFRTRKFFLQILAGVTNTDTITDPPGYVAPGVQIRIPFRVTEADIECTALLMTDENVVNLSLETPSGALINPGMAPGLGISFVVGKKNKHYRFTLPVAVGAGQQAGLWHAVLEVDKGDYRKALSQMRDRKEGQGQSFATHGARYNVVVQTYSNLRMSAKVDQSSFQPGADLLLRAVLTEYSVPVEKRSSVQVDLTRPGGAVITVLLTETEPGTFEATTRANVAGVYQARFMAKGVTLRGTPFTREQIATAAVWNGGDQPYEPPHNSGSQGVCQLIECLLGEKNIGREFEQRLRKEGIHLEGIRHCLKAYCRKAQHQIKG